MLEVFFLFIYFCFSSPQFHYFVQILSRYKHPAKFFFLNFQHIQVMQPDGTELEPLSARCCSALNAMKAILRMSTNHVTITRQQHFCEWCDDVSAEVLVSRSTKFLTWYKLEDQGTKIRLHFAAGNESGDASLHPEVEYLLRVEDSSDMQALITMMPGSIISSLWFGGLYYTEYDEILSITVNEFMRRRGCEPVRVHMCLLFDIDSPAPVFSIRHFDMNTFLTLYFSKHHRELPKVTDLFRCLALIV